jgi:hypothetical protein
MEIFLNLWNNWTNVEKLSITSIFTILLILIPLLVILVTKNKKLLYFTIASLITSALLTLLGIVFVNIIFGTTITYIFLLVPIIILFINILNIGTCVGYYELHKNKKSSNYNMLKVEYISDSIYLTIFLLLLFSAFSMFLFSTFLTFIVLTATLAVAVVWLNYALLYYIVK